jgi:hypothetical protein
MGKSPLKPLPDRLLIQLGRIATTTAFIEQEFVLWASAIYSQKTGGHPREELRITFQRLLAKWHSEAAPRFDRKTREKFLTPLRIDLNRMWPVRNAFIHGRWKRTARYQYEIDWWEQTKKHGLRHYEYLVTLSDVRHHADIFDRLLVRLYRHFDSGWPSTSPRKSAGRPTQADRSKSTKHT